MAAKLAYLSPSELIARSPTPEVVVFDPPLEVMHKRAPARAPGELCVIIVDESSSDRFQMRYALHRAGTARYQIFECADAASAKALVQRYAPDALLIDGHLQGADGQDGIAAMEELSRHCPDAACILITRQGDEGTAVRAMKAGAADYLVKDQVLNDPVRIDRAVQNAVHLKRLQHENIRFVDTLRQRNRELEELTKKLWELSHTDELTGFFNRRYIVARLEEEIARVQRSGRPLAIALVDLDHFKQVNDVYGHLAGDRALQTFAQLFRSKVRETDLVGRFGGEEFLLVLPETDLVGAEQLCNRLREQVQHQPVYLGDRLLSLTASFGVTACGPGPQTVTSLLRVADQLLYAAKAQGRNRVMAAMPPPAANPG